MARTFRDDMNEVFAVFPQIGPLECEAMLWTAIVDICNENDLSFMLAEAKIITEAPYSTGTVTVANDGFVVTLVDGTWDTSWTNRKIYIRGRNETYGITINTTTTGTLDDAWQGASDSGLSYTMFRDVYTVPTDCELSKELLLFDTVTHDQVAFVDYAEFRACKREMAAWTGIPTEVTRLSLNSNGVPQIEFGPVAPDSAKVYMLDYYRSPVKPTSLGQSVTPLWPEAFVDVRVLRVLWKYAFAHGHSRRFEFRDAYKQRVFEMVSKFDGGNEMRRRLRNTGKRNTTGLRIFARWGGN